MIKMLQPLRKSKGFTLKELGDRVGVAESTMSLYENDKREPDFETLLRLGEIFDVSVDYLLRGDIYSGQLEKSPGLFSIPGIFPITKQKIPLLGEVSCGELKFADEDFQGYVECGAEVRADFALRAKGDSMINARIQDGDVVFIRQQPAVDSGEIAAVLVEDEATLKRFFQYGNVVVLRAENPVYEDIVIQMSEDTNIRILGKAIAFQSDVK